MEEEHPKTFERKLRFELWNNQKEKLKCPICGRYLRGKMCKKCHWVIGDEKEIIDFDGDFYEE